MIIQFSHNSEEISIDTEKLLSIDDDISKELSSISAEYMRISSYISSIKAARDRKNVDTNDYYGARYHQFKAGAYEEMYGGKKPTEAGIENAMNEDSKYVAMRKEVISIGRILDQLYALQHSLNMKMDCIKELGSHIRQNKRLEEK